jgi:hypothetical protein
MTNDEKEEALKRHVIEKRTKKLIADGALDTEGDMIGSGTSDDPFKVRDPWQVIDLQRRDLAAAGVLVPDGPGPLQIDTDECFRQMDRLKEIN